jgi:putative ABC transport system permease protein
MPFSKHLVVRTEADPQGVVADVRGALQKVDTAVVIEGVKTMDAIRDDSVATQRFAMTLIAAFAIVALALSMVGLYGVMSHAVLQRSHEIGIRMAVGAQQHHVLRLILRQGIRLAAAGITVGLVGAFALTGTLRSMLYEVEAVDPMTFVGVSVILILAMLVACFVPARRATKVDPLIALRGE